MLILLASITFIATLFAIETKSVSLVDFVPGLIGAIAMTRRETKDAFRRPDSRLKAADAFRHFHL